jgi:hypothetical protein
MVPRKLNHQNFREVIFFQANFSFQFIRVRKLPYLEVGGQNLVCFLEILEFHHFKSIKVLDTTTQATTQKLSTTEMFATRLNLSNKKKFSKK